MEKKKKKKVKYDEVFSSLKQFCSEWDGCHKSVMDMNAEWCAEFAVQAEKETDIPVGMGISQCAHSASVCQEQQKIFNAQKGFNDLMNLLYWISQNPASKGFRKTCWLLARTAYLLDFTYFMTHDRVLLSHYIWG